MKKITGIILALTLLTLSGCAGDGEAPEEEAKWGSAVWGTSNWNP